IYSNTMVKTKCLSLRVKEIVFIVFLTLFEFLIIYYMTLLSDDAYGKFMMFIVIGFIIMNICVFYVVNEATVGYENQYELEKIKLKNQIQADHYDELNRTYVETRCLIHDINKHINAIEELSKNCNFHEATEYTEKLKEEIQKRKKLFECSNKILNAVINQKISLAESKGITVTFDIKNVILDFMKDTDVTAIFANILDNAIEACEEVTENKFISIKISHFNNFVYIDLANSYSGKILKSNDRFLTTKKDHMGYGMISIQRTLEKYNGYMNTEPKDKEFMINIVIPIP
ncbi:MAG: GHKL domain-containing protein, partial [Ruminococcus sp.]|nr:GHKL domain-containing protein [Ruminococcus sp.]